MGEKELLDIEDVVGNIAKVVRELDGDDVATAHNDICARKIEYIEDSAWRYTGEVD